MSRVSLVLNHFKAYFKGILRAVWISFDPFRRSQRRPRTFDSFAAASMKAWVDFSGQRCQVSQREERGSTTRVAFCLKP